MAPLVQRVVHTWWSLGLALLVAVVIPLGPASDGTDAAAIAPQGDPALQPAAQQHATHATGDTCGTVDAILGLVADPTDPTGASLGEAHLDDLDVRGWPTGLPDSELLRVHEALRHLDGFVDVQVILIGTPVFEVLFDGPVPALPEMETPLPLTTRDISEVAPTAPRPTDRPMSRPDIFPKDCSNLIHPGKDLAGCTVSWILRDESGHYYVTTAGHCVGAVGSRFSTIGTVAFKMDDGVGRDFGLVRIDEDKQHWVDPAMCHWGGPTRIADRGGVGNVLRQVGYGDIFGQADVTRPRTGVLRGMGVESYSYWAAVMPGDSGSPVRQSDGAAVGVHTHGVATAPGLKFGTVLTRGLLFAEHAVGSRLELMTAPLSENESSSWPEEYLPSPGTPQSAGLRR